jgi:uncharacterized membrane protein
LQHYPIRTIKINLFCQTLLYQAVTNLNSHITVYITVLGEHHPAIQKMSSNTPKTNEKSLMEKALMFGWKPTPAKFPELPNVIIWFRFILALCCGLYIGLAHNDRGSVNLLYALNLVTFVPVFYATSYLGASLEEFGNKVIFGGAFQSLALVVLIWIYLYTMEHAEDKAAFASMLNKVMEDAETATARASESLNVDTAKPA